MGIKYIDIKDKYTWHNLCQDYGHSNVEIIQQLPDELYCLINIYLNNKPKNILEIGTAYGGTLYYWLKYGVEGRKVVSLDISHEQLNFNYEHWGCDYDNLVLVTADSNDKKTYKKIKDSFDKFDFIFIDGNHVSPYPINDFIMYSQLINKGGIVALHDIQGSCTGNGAREAWEYIVSQNKYKTETFIHNNLVDFGIGVVYF